MLKSKVPLYFTNTHENHIKYFERVGWRYDTHKYTKNLPIYEYYKCCQYEKKSYMEWNLNDRIIKDQAIFVKIVKFVERPELNIISDITTASDNHSFIAGDSMCVHNSAMGKTGN